MYTGCVKVHTTQHFGSHGASIAAQSSMSILGHRSKGGIVEARAATQAATAAEPKWLRKCYKVYKRQKTVQHIGKSTAHKYT